MPTKFHLVKAMVFPIVVLDYKESWVPKNWCFWTVVLEKSLESPLDCKEISPGISLEGMMLKLETPLATWCEELTPWKRLWCWEGLGAGGEGDDRGWDGWMASPTQWTWVWVNSESWWWTGRPGVLQFMGSQRVRHNWATELNWTDIYIYIYIWNIEVRIIWFHVSKCLFQRCLEASTISD